MHRIAIALLDIGLVLGPVEAGLLAPVVQVHGATDGVTPRWYW